MDKISKEEIIGLATELQFTLSDQEISEVINEFDVLMQQLQLLEAIDTNDVKELVYPLDKIVSTMREDVVDHVLSVDKVLHNAPVKKDNFVIVPKVVK